jgi:hypothetical protein
MATKSLFDAAEKTEVLARIERLRADSPAKWGKMNVAQALAHCQQPLRVATGELKLERGLIGVLFGGIAKRSLSGPKDFSRDMPTDPHFVVTDARDFASERKQLVALVERFSMGGEQGLTREKHPFFGALTTAQWEALMWKHLDHHLRQFGV